MCICFYLSICFYVSIYHLIYPSTYLSIIHIHTYIYLYLSIDLSSYPSTFLSIYQLNCLSIDLVISVTLLSSISLSFFLIYLCLSAPYRSSPSYSCPFLSSCTHLSRKWSSCSLPLPSLCGWMKYVCSPSKTTPLRPPLQVESATRDSGLPWMCPWVSGKAKISQGVTHKPRHPLGVTLTW